MKGRLVQNSPVRHPSQHDAGCQLPGWLLHRQFEDLPVVATCRGCNAVTIRYPKNSRSTFGRAKEGEHHE